MEQKQRPVFLTVLCILSYVGLGWNIFSGLVNLVTSKIAGSFSPLIEKLSRYALHLASFPGSDKVDDIIDFAQKALENAFNMNLVNILLSLLALFGVVLMWRLKKTGFYLYSGAKIFIVSIPLMFMGVNFITLILTTIGGLFAMIFIILYAINLKHLA